MKPHIDFVECVKDSPKFRAHIELTEADIDVLEGKLEKVIKQCHGMVDSGRLFGTANSAYIAGLQELVAYFKSDEVLVSSVKRLVQTMSELQNFHSILLDQTHKSVCVSLRKFINSDIKPVKDIQKEFKKSSDDLDLALMKHIQAPKARLAECEEANNMLIAAKSRFMHTSLDYSFHLNVLNMKKRHDTLGALTGYTNAQSTYFHNGSGIFADLESNLKSLALQVEELKHLTAIETKHMENRHSLVQDQRPVPQGSNAEGYLFKRTSKGFKSWVRRWFCIDNNQLVYTKQLSEGYTVMEEDLRLCSVKVASADLSERRFCFEVRSPARSHVLQATSEEECSRWVTALQAGVAAAYRDQAHTPPALTTPAVSALSMTTQALSGMAPRDDTSSGQMAGTKVNGRFPGSNQAAGSGEGTAKITSSASSRSLSTKTANQVQQLILSVPGNERCCDCGVSEPCWASANLGITLCIECSGIHRSLGVHVSKVRSLTLDTWEPEMVKVMAEMGNDTFNSIYEANVSKAVQRAEPLSDRSKREAWIKAKYVKKAFVKHFLADIPRDTSAAGSEEKSKSLKWSVQIRNRKTLTLPHSNSSEQAGAEDITPRSPERDNAAAVEVVLFGARFSEADACRPSIDSDSDDDDGTSTGAGGECDRESRTSLEEVERLDANTLLYRAAEARNIPVMAEALANGADINWQCPRAQLRTPLIRAVESGSLAACEFLLLNGARVDIADERSRPPLHHATLAGHTAQVCQLLKRGANQRHRDVDGIDALSLAVKAEQADIVTLLRVANLRQEMTDADPGIQSDELFNDVFRDFTNLASSDPDKLKRETVSRVVE